MYKTPFHRRVLPWLFVFIFLGLAPVLVFYTAGYRYNPKKNLLEKNGSLIVDSNPAGASVLIDGQSTGETTPVTIQNVTPGIHTIQVERTGYLPWKKNLEVKNEQVTFANHIWLWHPNDPIYVSNFQHVKLETDEQGDFLGVLEVTASSSNLSVFNDAMQRQRLIPLTSTSTSENWALRWHPDGRQILAQNELDQTAILVEFERLQQLKITHLSIGNYLWSGNTLINEALPEAIIQGISIKTNTSTGAQILVDDGIISNSFALPPGSWRLHTIKRPFVLLQDHQRWLAVQLKKSAPFAGQLLGDTPHWLNDRKQPTALFHHDNEIWLWELGQTPQLLWRMSEGIVQVAWHPESQHIIFATKTDIKALDLDDRNGRNITTLATFEAVKDIAVLKNQLIVSGTKQAKNGLWKVLLE